MNGWRREKAIRTHKKPLWIRLPSRLPIAVLIWFVGVLFPFYSTVNSLFAAVTGESCNLPTLWWKEIPDVVVACIESDAPTHCLRTAALQDMAAAIRRT